MPCFDHRNTFLAFPAWTFLFLCRMDASTFKDIIDPVSKDFTLPGLSPVDKSRLKLVVDKLIKFYPSLQASLPEAAENIMVKTIIRLAIEVVDQGFFIECAKNEGINLPFDPERVLSFQALADKIKAETGRGICLTGGARVVIGDVESGDLVPLYDLEKSMQAWIPMEEFHQMGLRDAVPSLEQQRKLMQFLGSTRATVGTWTPHFITALRNPKFTRRARDPITCMIADEQGSVQVEYDCAGGMNGYLRLRIKHQPEGGAVSYSLYLAWKKVDVEHGLGNGFKKIPRDDFIEILKVHVCQDGGTVERTKR